MNTSVIIDVFPDGKKSELFLTEPTVYKLPVERTIHRIKHCVSLAKAELQKNGSKSCSAAISFYVFGFYITLKTDVNGYKWKLTGYEHIRKSGTSLSGLLDYVVSEIQKRGSNL